MRFSILDCDHERTKIMIRTPLPGFTTKHAFGKWFEKHGTEDVNEIATLLDNASRGTAEVICMRCLWLEVERMIQKDLLVVKGINREEAWVRLYKKYTYSTWVVLNN